jgi:thiol-disulfide isomerase/thioredoxin
MDQTRQNTPARTWWLIAAAFVVSWVAYLVFFVPRPHVDLEHSGTDQPADYSWTILDLNDRPVSFSTFQGRPVFLNIWATWCGPCVAELPSIARLARHPQLAGKPIAFVCVSTDDSSETVSRFLKGKDWPMTFLRTDKIPPVFYSEGIPATFLIGADGKVAAVQIGSVEWDEPKVVAFLEKLASGRATAAGGVGAGHK